ncbi:MAG: copper amine oxidase [Oscillospiraceae bacterium]|nr:copper amine oxidase [Oscillospiraceae bacterium]
MKRKLACLLLALALCVSIGSQTLAIEDTTQTNSSQTDVASVAFDGTVADSYVSLRTVAEGLRPDAWIDWNGSFAAVYADDLTITATPGDSYIVANGRYLYVPNLVTIQDGNVMAPASVIAKALGATTWYSEEWGRLFIIAGTGTIESGDTYYRSDDVYWLSHIINAESGNQPLAGKIAVGNVILNRVSDSRFPDTIYEVIFQKNQFTPASSGSVNRDPNADSIIAAKLCLDGAMVLSSAYWFNSVQLTSSWASTHKTYVATIGNHNFYG